MTYWTAKKTKRSSRNAATIDKQSMKPSDLTVLSRILILPPSFVHRRALRSLLPKATASEGPLSVNKVVSGNGNQDPYLMRQDPRPRRNLHRPRFYSRILRPREKICCRRVRLPHRLALLHYRILLFRSLECRFRSPEVSKAKCGEIEWRPDR